jgi:hypothetical protein
MIKKRREDSLYRRKYIELLKDIKEMRAELTKAYINDDIVPLKEVLEIIDKYTKGDAE